MSETVVIGDATLIWGDCREVLPTLGRFDAVITDPPYAEKTHAGARTGGGGEILIDFSSISAAEFEGLCVRLLACTDRWIVMTCDWRHAAHAEEKFPDEFIRAGVWIKPNGMPQYTGDRPATGWEAIAILHNKGRKRWNGGGRHAVWNIPKVHGNHPTEKPIALAASFVDLFTERDETVLDPFMGSGTSGVAAVQMGRKFVGIEMDRRHFETACRRIEQAQAQGQLIPHEMPKQVQESLV